MRQQWQEIPRDNIRGQWAALYVTMNPKGKIVLSRYTYERLGEPAAFKVLFDDANNIIGLQPTVLSARNAFRACVVTSSLKGGKGGRAINAFRLVQDCNIRLPDTIKFVAPRDRPRRHSAVGSAHRKGLAANAKSLQTKA